MSEATADIGKAIVPALASNVVQVLNMAEAVAHLGYWRYDVVSGALDISAEARHVHGFPPDARPTLEAMLDAYARPERDRLRAMLADAHDDESYTFDAQLTACDGSVRAVAVSGGIERGMGGQVTAIVGMVQDLTDRKAAEREREGLIERMTLAARAGKIGVWDFNVATSMLVFDDAMFALYGIAPNVQSVREAWWQALHPDDAPRVEAEIQAALSSFTEFESEFRIRRPDGEIRRVRSMGSIIRDADGNALRMVGTNSDITEVRSLAAQLRAEQNALRLSESRYRALTEAIPQLLFVQDEAGGFDYVNARWTRYTGLTIDHVHATGHADVIDAHGRALLGSQQRQSPPQEFECEIRLRRRDGMYRWHLVRAVPMPTIGASAKWIVCATDIEDRKNTDAQLAQAAAELAHRAHHDPLTNLPNRNLLMDRLAQAIARAERDGERVTVVYLDLDRFKLINDRWGHAAGDRVLAEVGARIARTLGSADTASRVGGDEFILVCARSGQSDDPTQLTARLLAAIAEPIDIGDTPITVGASIGISRYPIDDVAPDALVRKADAAMYAAKKSGRNTFRVYSDTNADA